MQDLANDTEARRLGTAFRYTEDQRDAISVTRKPAYL
jgi:hypothetical protein